MVHELLGIQSGRVNLSLVPDISPDLSVCPLHICFILMLMNSKEITLTPSTDPFFAAHSLATFGDLGTVLKTYVQSYQSRSLAQGPSSINSISDMKRFVEEYPEFRKLGGNVSKHVALVGELSRIVGRDKLLEVGEVEQGLATSSGADFKVIVQLDDWRMALIPFTCSVGRASNYHRGNYSSMEQTSCGNIIRSTVPEDANDQHCIAHQSPVGQWCFNGRCQSEEIRPSVSALTEKFLISSWCMSSSTWRGLINDRMIYSPLSHC